MKNVTKFPCEAIFNLGFEYEYKTGHVVVEVLARCRDESDYCIRIPVGFDDVTGIPGAWVESDGRAIITGVSCECLTPIKQFVLA